MAFPWIMESNFEQGTNAEWTSESDTGSLLDFPHYHTLINDQYAPMPYRGAYCMRILAGDTNDHTVTSTSIVCADTATIWTRFYMYVANNFTASADDVFNIYELQQAGGTVESSLGMRITAATNALEIGVGDGTAPSSYVSYPGRGKWVLVELESSCQTNGTGKLTLYLNEVSAIALTSLTEAAAFGKGVLGTQDTLSTTTGGIYFDQFVVDDLRVYGIPIRYPMEMFITKTQHVFVGQGVVNVALMSGSSTDSVLQIFDTDQNNTNHTGRMKVELKGVAANTYVDSHFTPVNVQRGCYAVLSGTTPRAMIQVQKAQGYCSEGRIRQHAMAWTNTPGSW